MAELTALGKQSAAEQDQDDDGVNDLFDETTVEGVSVKTPLPPQPLPAAPSVEPLVARPLPPRTLTLTLTLTLALALALTLTLTLTLDLTLTLSRRRASSVRGWGVTRATRGSPPRSSCASRRRCRRCTRRAVPNPSPTPNLTQP